MEQLINKYRAELSKKGIKYTGPRDILLRYILNLRDHFNADLLYLNSKAHGINISRATIYRNLPLFEECGIIKKALQDKDRHYYEVSIKKKHHDHLICIECGKIVEFRSNKIEVIQKEIYKKYKYSPTNHQLILKGVCEKCSRKKMKRTLASLSNNEEGMIHSVEGGTGARAKLDAMGIRPGKKIKKMSSQIFKGPVVVEIDGRDIALGHGLAKKVLIE